MQKVIGGEFDIDVTKIGKMHTLHNAHLFSSGRAALYHILKLLYSYNQFTKVLLPDYLCESIIDAVKKSKFKFEFYNIDEDLAINMDSLNIKCCESSVVLLINYFGCVDISKQIQTIREISKNSYIITDNVQGYYAMSQSIQADFSFTSFRKCFPVPDGALVETFKNGLANLSNENTFVANKITGGILKHFAENNNIDDAIYLNFFDQGEKEIDKNYNSKASDFSKILLNSIDFDDIKKRRNQNAAYLVAGLEELGIKPIVKNNYDQVPLFIPIRLKNRDIVRKQMFSENIFCPIHWPAPIGLTLKRGAELSTSELSLIVDQRYDENDLQRILDVLKKYYK